MSQSKHLAFAIAVFSLAMVFLTPVAVRAQDPLGTPPPLRPAETPPPRVEPKVTKPEPEPEPTATPAATPRPTPRVRAPKPTPTPSNEPVAVVNGSPVYRPLFQSVVADPVDRALVLQEYRRRGYVLPAHALDEALKNHAATGFGDAEKLNLKLQEQGASYDDYRGFVAEEVKLQAMLAVVSKGARSDGERRQARESWIAGLRKAASINKSKKV